MRTSKRWDPVTILALGAILYAAIPGVSRAAEGWEIQAFTIQEAFGVSHPDQIVDFDVAADVDPASAYLVGPDGREVPFQLLEGGRKVAVRTDLPAGTSKTWKLMSGRGKTVALDLRS